MLDSTATQIRLPAPVSADPFADLDLSGVPTDTLAVIYRALASAAERESGHQALLYAAQETLAASVARLADLEALVAGYRRRVLRFACLVRERQALDPMRVTEQVDGVRRAEAVQLERAGQLETWALQVLSGGALFAEAAPPPDWASMQRMAAALAQGVHHG